MTISKKNILIIGGHGFIGSNLIDLLILGGLYNIFVFDKVGKQNNSAEYHHIAGDYNNLGDLESFFSSNSVEIVVHLASTTVPSTPNGKDMLSDIETNLIGTIQLLNLMVKYKVRNILFTSSGGTVYGSEDHASYSEADWGLPISSHGIVKQTIERYLFLYNYHFGINYLILRISNPYGENHKSLTHGFINVSLRKIINNETVIVYGDGSVVRDYIYINDLVRIMVKLINIGFDNQIINIGSGLGYSINDILKVIACLVGDFSVNYVASNNFDVPRVVLNNMKLLSIIDFKLTPIDKGILQTYLWQMKYKL